jgi:hypothetical protein
MTVTTHIEQARTQVRTEREAIDAKRRAFERFRDRVAAVQPEPAPSSSRITATGGTLHQKSSSKDRCRTVRTAFDETIRPHSVADVDGTESLLTTIRNELSESIALALAPTTESTFSATLKEAIVSEASARRTEIDVLHRALVREEAHLDDAGDVVDDVTTWITDADQTPLTDLGFEALRTRHETLAGHRDRCAELARERQAFLRQTTNENVDVGIRHRSLVPYLYGEFPVDHPVLTTVVRLDSVCAECQRAVRQHLVRRV